MDEPFIVEIARGPVDVLGSLRMMGVGPGDPSTRARPGFVAKAANLHVREGKTLVARPITLAVFESQQTYRIEIHGARGDTSQLDIDGLVGRKDDAFESFAPTHPRIVDIAKRSKALRLVRLPWVYDALVATVFQQKVAFVDAARSYRAMLHELARPAPGPFELLLPPSAIDLKGYPLHDAMRLGIDAKRIRAIRATSIYADRIDALAKRTLSESRAFLMALDGIGPWTTESVLGGVLGDADAVPVGDYWIPHTVSFALTGEPRAPKENPDGRLLELLLPFTGNRYRVIRLIEAAGIGAPRFGPRMRFGHDIQADRSIGTVDGLDRRLARRRAPR